MIRCSRCQGSKKIAPMGGIYVNCTECKATGVVDISKSQEKRIEAQIGDVVELRVPPRFEVQTDPNVTITKESLGILDVSKLDKRSKAYREYKAQQLNKDNANISK